MKKIIACILILLFSVTCYADVIVQLNKQQIKKLDIVDAACREQYPEYGGMHNYEDGFLAVGITDKPQFEEFLSTIDLNDDDKVPNRKAIKQCRQKLKNLGLNNSDLKVLGLELD